MTKDWLVLPACLIAIGTALAQEPSHTPLHLWSAVQDKNFYLLSLIEQTADVNRSVRSDPKLAKLGEVKRAGLAKAADSCGTVLACYATAMKFSDGEIDEAAEAFKGLYRKDPEMRRMIDGPLRESGTEI